MYYSIEELAESLRIKSGKKEYTSLLCHRSVDEGKAAWKKHESRVSHAILHSVKEGETEGHKGRSKQSYGCASKHKVGLSSSPKEGSVLFKAMEHVREHVRESFLKAKFERLTIEESGLYFHEFVQVARELYSIPLSFRKEREGNLSFTADSLLEYGIAWNADILSARKEAEEVAEEAEEVAA